MIRRPPRSTPLYSSAASDVYKRQLQERCRRRWCGSSRGSASQRADCLLDVSSSDALGGVSRRPFLWVESCSMLVSCPWQDVSECPRLPPLCPVCPGERTCCACTLLRQAGRKG